MIIVVGGIKGGAGKSTIAVNLAARRASEHNVLIVDGDEQETTTDRKSTRLNSSHVSQSRMPSSA